MVGLLDLRSAALAFVCEKCLQYGADRQEGLVSGIQQPFEGCHAKKLSEPTEGRELTPERGKSLATVDESSVPFSNVKSRQGIAAIKIGWNNFRIRYVHP